MTEYEHVTDRVEEAGAAKVNLSKTKLFVDLRSPGWNDANSLVKEYLREVDAKFFYKTQSRIFLWENYFRQQHKVRSLDFWETILSDFSKLDELDVHAQTKTVVRKTLMEVIGIFLNSDCVLLPFVGPRGKDTPLWHAHVKPEVKGYPYDQFFSWYQVDLDGLVPRLKRAPGRHRLIFSSVYVPDVEAYTALLDKIISQGLEASFKGDHLTEGARYLQLLATKCAAVRGEEPFTTHLRLSRRIRTVHFAKGAATFSEDVELIPSYDPILGMRTYVEARLEKLNFVHRKAWGDAIEDWLSEKSGIQNAPLYKDVIFFCEWMASNGLSERRPDQVDRGNFVRSSQNTSGIAVTFFEHLARTVEATHAKARIARNLVDFFAFSSDSWTDGSGRALQPPLNESDKKRFPDTRAKDRGKSNKPVLPRRIIELSKQILLEDDYAFARAFKDQFVTIADERVFVPTFSNILYLILCIPIRTAQAVMLDSGEADEFRVALDGTLEKNQHPLARKGRRLGYARRFSGVAAGSQFSALFINTNKEAAHEQKGYEIPFHDPSLMRVLEAQRFFQEKHNPTDVMIDRSQIGVKDWKYHGSRVDELESYTFLFRDIRKGKRRWDLPSRSHISKLWQRLLSEVQSRLEEQGTPVQLVYEDEAGRQKTDFTLHSLRVSNITHFIEAGVPLHVLAEFLSGHQTLVMTLYYTKLGPRKIHEVIAEASKSLYEADEDEFFDRLTEMSSEFLNEQVVGKNDGLARLPDGDPGLWHVDADGFCTAGKTMCGEGLEKRNPETEQVVYEPIYPDGFNCALCRFHVTGPAFLAGQVTVANTLFYAIRERSEQQDRLFQKVSEARSRGNNREAQRAQDQLDKVEMELEERIAALGARIGNIYACLNLMDEQDKKGSEKTALLTKLDANEIEARLTEASNFEGVEWASQAVEFFPQLPDSGARFRKGILLERMAQENGLKPLLLHLSDDEMHRASNRLTALMTEFYGQQETTDLISGKVKLEEIGGMARFESLLGKAIELSEPKAPQLASTLSMIGAAREQ